MNDIEALTLILANNHIDSCRTAAVLAFKFFHQMAKERVIDKDILEAMIHDAGYPL